MLHDIAVVSQFVGNDYCDEIIRGIKNFLSDKPVRISVLEVRTPEGNASDYEYQYWSGFSLVQAKSFEAVILISGTFCSEIKKEDLINLMQPFFNCPVVSVSIDLPFKNSYFTHSDCYTAIRQTMVHLVEEHGCKKIGMVTANETSSDEGRERFEAYKKILSELNMEYDEDCVFHSNFSQHGTIIRMREKLKTKEDVKFDAVFCANDFSAFGAVMVLQELGLKIPEDVVVTGFDDCSQAAKEVVPLTTINQDVGAQGYGAAKTAYDLITGKTSERMISVPARPVYRESCGCTSHDENDVSKIGNVHTETKKYFDNANYNVSYFSLLDKIQSSQTLTRMYALVNTLFEEVNIKTFALVLYKEPVLVEKNETFVLPHEAELAMAFDHPHNFSALNIGKSFDPYESILPEGFLDTSANNFVVNSIFFGEKQYGYMMYQQGNRIPSFYAVYMKIVSNAIARSYDYTKALETRIKLEQENKILQQSNTELNTVSKTDELTGVYNRRGFLHLGQQEINLALQRKTTGLIIFGDMDGLKSINDTYGHEAGDEAIKAEASILSQAFRVNDIIGRMGGDEFAIVCTGMKMSALEKKIEEITRLCAEWKTANKSPFTLSMSLGACEFNSEKFILQELLTEADIAQYLVKKEKHAERQS